MKKMKWLLTVAMICFLPLTLLADEFISYPGTRAKGMGGAYTAISSEVSSIWYNPAGLAMDPQENRKIKSLLFEYSQGVGMDEESSDFDRGVDEHNFFLGGAWSNGSAGIGLAWYTPYAVDAYFRTSDSSYRLLEDMHIFSLGGALAFWDKRMKIGGTLEAVMLDLDNSVFNSGYMTVEAQDTKHWGFSGSLGLLFDVISQGQFEGWARNFKLTLGYNHRFGCEAEEFAEVLESAETKLIESSSFDKPASDNAGIALSFPVWVSDESVTNTLTLAYDYSRTYWSDANEYYENDYEKNALGLEYTISFPNAAINAVSFRTGCYASDATKPEEGWGDVSAWTLGAGIKFKKWAIELAYEKRDYEYPERREDSDESFDLFSVALVCDF